MNKHFIENIMAFSLGDALATISLCFTCMDWLNTVEMIGLKLVVIVVSGFIGGAFGLLGKEFTKRYFKIK